MSFDGKIKCSNCGWDKTVCDVHHIHGRKIDRPNSFDNLSYLCPNCHRLAHKNILKPEELISLSSQIKDEWKKYYNFPFDQIEVEGKGDKIKRKSQLNDERIQSILSSNIDFSKLGWIEKTSSLIGITPQKVAKWMKSNMLDFYTSKCYKRK